jgi:hypothetical protein
MADAEQLVIDYLKTVDEVTDIVDTKVSEYKGKPYPRVSIARIGGGDQQIPAHLDPVRIQFDCWGSNTQLQSKAEAHSLAAAVTAAMMDIVNHDHDEGVVTDARTILGPVWQPDPTTNQDRYIVDMLIRVHPNPSS